MIRRHSPIIAIVLLISGMVFSGACASRTPVLGGDSMTIDAIESEVVSLHEFFAAWFRGSLPLEAFDQFERALDEDFLIVTPAGRAIGREAILDAVRDARGGDPGARIWIRDVQLRRHLGDVVVATYEEWQQSGAEPPRGRLSTVVFRRDANAAHGMRWAHVHETWLPPEQ